MGLRKGWNATSGSGFDGWPPLLPKIDNFDWTSVQAAARVSARRHFILTLE
jgi:hypothetical protein